MGFFASGEDYSKDEYRKIGEGVDTSEAEMAKTPDFEKNKAQLMSLYVNRRQLGGPASVVATHAKTTAPSTAGLNAQKFAASQYLAALDGRGPSVAPTLAKQAKDEALRARLAAVAGARPTALAQQQATGAASTMMQQGALQSAQAKAGEVGAARQGYGQIGTAMRGADLQTAQQANAVAFANAGADQAASLANQGTAIGWERMSDAERTALLGMMQGLDANEANNFVNHYRQQWGLALDNRAINMRDQMNKDAMWANAVMGAGAAGGYAAQAWGAKRDQGWDSYAADLRR